MWRMHHDLEHDCKHTFYSRANQNGSESDDALSDPGTGGSAIKMGMNSQQLFNVSGRHVQKPSKNEIKREKIRKQHSRLRGIPSNKDIFFCPVEACQEPFCQLVDM
eukprot:1158313_1